MNYQPDLARLGEDLDGVAVRHVLRSSDKSVLALGERGGEQVVVKVLRTADTFWQATFDREIGVYRAFARTPPPVRVPRLVHTDGRRVLVIEHVAGRPADQERYPDIPLPAATLDAVLAALTGFTCWRPPPGTLAPVFNYPDRVARYRRAGFFNQSDRAALQVLLDQCGPPTEPNHGDPLPANLLIETNGQCVPVDWEFTGLFLPGFDLAMLHALLVATPTAQARIEALVAQADIEAAFLVNQAMVLSRELRLHTELPADQFRERRLAILRPQWDAVRARLHQER